MQALLIVEQSVIPSGNRNALAAGLKFLPQKSDGISRTLEFLKMRHNPLNAVRLIPSRCQRPPDHRLRHPVLRHG